MHIENLGVILWSFLRAKQARHKTHIAGCGIGPLNGGQEYQSAVTRILSLADTIELRDSSSVAWAKAATGREDLVCSGDYAVGFVKRWMEQHPTTERSPFLNVYLRDWCREYQGDLTDTQFIEMKQQFEVQLGKWIHTICDQQSIRPRLLPMHHFFMGNDDRDFNRRFARTYLADLEPIVELRPMSAQDILASMTTATFCLCMRFHSVLFADTLGVPYVAIDYTLGGKVAGYLQDRDRADKMISIQDVASGEWTHML